MARPIRATPELKGKEASDFLAKMLQRESSPATKMDIKLAKAIQDFSKAL